MRSIQVNNTHRCAGCGTFYIPYDQDVPCPQCGLVEKQRCDFVPRAVHSLLYNLEHYQTFLPAGWVAQSFADYVLAILLQVFHAYTVSGEEKSFYEFSRETLEKYLDVHGRAYLLDHMHALAMRMSEELRKRPTPQAHTPVAAQMGVRWQRRQFSRR